MKKIEDLKIGEVVYVTLKDEKEAVVGIHPPTISVKFMTAVPDVEEGDVEGPR